ncbi:hypothetical protein HELRODRAFT_166608 [Helobdella robusta]|uniref:VWFA domain-containing protein n=1 Tax=Helobdella robusta TaxID=6412 RepID=T1EYA5_HELRO|nr:hypothetical protein HELRODRAFT_166608 [Helobdella robusta]ESO11596.1 hypothetical protein HELRODRAFT_166608 [Helobdella robusta]
MKSPPNDVIVKRHRYYPPTHSPLQSRVYVGTVSGVLMVYPNINNDVITYRQYNNYSELSADDEERKDEAEKNVLEKDTKHEDEIGRNDDNYVGNSSDESVGDGGGSGHSGIGGSGSGSGGAGASVVVDENVTGNVDNDLAEFRLQSWFLGKLNQAKHVAELLINTFTSHYYINVISSSSMIWDIQGHPIDQTTTALSCKNADDGNQGCGLYPANDHNKKTFLRLIHKLKPRGGTDLHRAFDLAFDMMKLNGKSCIKHIYLITSARDSDKKVRCSSGTIHFLEDNQKKFAAGNTCKYNMDRIEMAVSIMQYYASHTIDIYTFVTSSQYVSYSRISNLACHNGGFSIWINGTNNYTKQLRLYIEAVLYSSPNSSFDIDTSTLLSTDTKSSIHISLPVFILSDDNRQETDEEVLTENSEKIVGVVGFELSYTHLHNLLMRKLWKGSDVFLVHAWNLMVPLHHKMIPINEQFRHDLSLNMVVNPTNSLKEYQQIVKTITDMTSPTTLVVTSIPKIPLITMSNTIVTPEYSYDPAGSSSPTLTYQDKNNMNVGDGNESLFYYFAPIKNQHFNLEKNASSLGLSMLAFCDMEMFADQFDPTKFLDLEDYLNGPNEPKSSKECTLIQPDTSLEIEISQTMEEHWKDTLTLPSPNIKMRYDDVIDSRYLLSANGVMRVFPAVHLKADLLMDAHHEDWFKDALAYRFTLAVTPGKHTRNFQSNRRNLISLNRAVLYPCGASTTGKCLTSEIWAVVGTSIRMNIFVSRLATLINRKYEISCGTSDMNCYIIRNNLQVVFELRTDPQASQPSIIELFPEELQFLMKHKNKRQHDKQRQEPCVRHADEYVIVKAKHAKTYNTSCQMRTVHLVPVSNTNVFLLVFKTATTSENKKCAKKWVSHYKSEYFIQRPSFLPPRHGNRSCDLPVFVPLPCVTPLRACQIQGLTVHFIIGALLTFYFSIQIHDSY